MASAFQEVSAQNRNISGRVTDRQTGDGLPGVTVLVKGTTNGVSTNSDGTFALSNVPAGATLVLSSIGYISVERAVGTEDQINIGLASDSKQLSEVVVTSLGIERDTRSLGYTTQEIKAEQLSQKSEPNVLNALQGKVAGVTITSSSGLPGSSTNINIRGISSLGGSNQPLFVVDGIPISNDLDRTNGGPLGSLGGAQTANRAVDIDPELIESINVLKGPAAAALYGSRAGNGAIIITTKSGRNVNKKLEVTLTSGLSVQQVFGLPEFQNDYGQGNAGTVITTNGAGDVNTASVNSWGPRFGTTPTQANGLLLANGSLLPYQPYKDNIKDFFRLGRLLTNGVNLRGGNAEQNFSINFNNTNQKGITKFSELQRLSGQIGGNTTLLNKIKAGGSMNLTQTDQLGPLVGNGASAFGQLINVPRSYDFQNQPYRDAANRSIFLVGAGADNPYWNLENNPTTSKTTRVIANANISYDFTPWLNVLYRAGLDTYTDRRKQVFALTAARVPTGLIRDEVFFRSQFTGDLIATLKKDNILTEGLNATLLLGNQINSRRFQNIASQADNLLVPGFPNSSVGSVFSNGTGEATNQRRLIGYYGQLSLAYKNFLFVEFQGRTDISSTLPKNNNTYFYPAANFSFVFTDALRINSDIFTYGKIKGSAAQVGKDTDPYNLATTYGVASFGNNVANLTFPFVGAGGFSLGNTKGLPTLKPEFNNSFDGGINLGFFNNRLTLDLTYFYTRSGNQILALTTPASTGYLSRIENAGRLDNKGIEALVTITPVRTNNFRWDINANYTRIRNKVVELADGVEQASVGGNAFTGTIPSYRVGQPYGIIVGNAYERSPDGQYLIDSRTGTFLRTVPNSILADPNFDWQAGITNNLTFKGASLSFLIDTNQGGDVVSFTNGFYRSRGALKETGVDRELPRVIPGVIPITNADGSITYKPNNIQIPAQTYWQSFGLQSDLNVYDATVYRLREVSIGYTVPKSILERLPFGTINVSLSGRNLFYYAPNANFDPELNTQGAGNIRGLDLQGPPNARTYGVNLRLTL